MTFTHVHGEPEPLEYPNPEGYGTVAEFVPFTPYTISYHPYVTPLSEIPAALGGTAS